MTSPPVTDTSDARLVQDTIDFLNAQVPPAETPEAPEQPQDDIFRTKRDGVFKLHECFFGAYLAKIDDPQSNAEIAPDDLKRFMLHPEYSMIPTELWAPWIKLCFDICGKTAAEVSMRLLQRIGDRTQWRAVVPLQVITGGSVRTGNFSDSIDLVTGEVLTSYPPEGWMAVGSSHSHNTMPAFFSSTDDEYELNDPGIHIVVGNIQLAANEYTPLASITNQKRRFIIPYVDIVDVTSDNNPYHPDVMGYIFESGNADYAAVNQVVKAEQARNEWPKKLCDYRTPSQLNAGNGYGGLTSWDGDICRGLSLAQCTPRQDFEEACYLLKDAIPEASAYLLLEMQAQLNLLTQDINDLLSDLAATGQDRAASQARPDDCLY